MLIHYWQAKLTHTHTHASTHRNTYTMPPKMYTTHACTHNDTCTTHTPTIHKHASHTHIHLHKNAHTPTHKYKYNPPPPPTPPTHTHTYTNTHIHHTHTPHEHTHTYVHHTHTHMYTHTPPPPPNTHIHTHTHVYTVRRITADGTQRQELDKACCLEKTTARCTQQSVHHQASAWKTQKHSNTQMLQQQGWSEKCLTAHNHPSSSLDLDLSSKTKQQQKKKKQKKKNLSRRRSMSLKTELINWSHCWQSMEGGKNDTDHRKQYWRATRYMCTEMEWRSSWDFLGWRQGHGIKFLIYSKTPLKVEPERRSIAGPAHTTVRKNVPTAVSTKFLVS